MATPGCVMVFVLLGFAPRVEGVEMKIQLNASMLKMHPQIATRDTDNVESIVATAVDGDPGFDVHSPLGWIKCAKSENENGVAHWMAIDLRGVFFISNVNATFRYDSGQNVGVFVGNNPSVTDGRYEYQCGDRLPNSNVLRAPHWYSFACQPTRWVSYVSIQRTGYQYIQICEVAVYYKQNTTVGVSVSFTAALNSPQTAFVGEPLLCTTSLVSSNATAILQLQWLFSNGTAVSQHSHANVTQQYNDNSVGLSFNSLTALPGNYSCRYTLNGKQRSHTVSVSAFDCGWSDWSSSSCSESCGKGTRRRQHRNSVTQRSESGCNPPTQQCFNTTCGKLNLTKIGASATQGPESQSASSMSASLAIDGRIVTDNSNKLNLTHCAASKSSSSVRTWLRIDLQNVHVINEVIVTFYGSTGRNAMIRVGSYTSNDGNDNLLCGTIEDYTDFADRVNVQRTVQCDERLWGRYVNVQRQTAQNLEICEVEIYTELDVGIIYNEFTVTTVYVDEGGGLPEAIACGMSPDTTGYNDALKLNWRRADGTPIPIQTSPTSTISQSSNNQQNLYVKNVSIDEEGWYVCEYTMPEGNQTNTLSLEILVNVDCGWSEWSDCSSTCGVGGRSRSADSPAQRHRGRECKGPSVESCPDLPPCAPAISNFATTKQVDKGGSLELRCEALISNLQNVNQTVSFQWAKYGRDGEETIIPIPDNDERVTSASHRDPNRLHFFYGVLRLTALSQLDSGSYTCRINSSIGTSSYTTDTVSVNVKFAPENVTLHQPLVAVKGKSATFTCTADGNPTPTYTWLKDGKPVASKQMFSIGMVSYASAGVYVCVANNTIEAGWKTGRASATVKVEGPPENCSIRNAACDSYSSSSLTFDVICFDGNSPITGYLLRFKKTSLSVWETREVTANSANAQKVVLTDLEANTQYEVQAKGGNRHGYATGSESFSVMTTTMTSTTASTTAEIKPCDCQCPIGAIVGASVASNVILIIALVVAVKVLQSRRVHQKSYDIGAENTSEETTQMTKSPLYEITGMIPLPPRAQTSDSEYETCVQESEDQCDDYVEISNKKETTEI